MKKYVQKHCMVYNEFEIIETIYREKVEKGLIKLEVGHTCPYCFNNNLDLVEGREPYTIDHLQCPTCDSTYNL